MQVTTPTSDALAKYLDLASDQMKLTAQNMANVDTPGYKTQGLDFAGEFSRALGTAASTPLAVNVSPVRRSYCAARRQQRIHGPRRYGTREDPVGISRRHLAAQE